MLNCNGCNLSSEDSPTPFRVCEACKGCYCDECEPLLEGLNSLCGLCIEWSDDWQQAEDLTC